MSRSLALLRPEPGWSASAAAARAAGLAVTGHPLFAAQPIDWVVPAGSFDALLVGSAAVFRHGGAALERLRAVPVHAVGEATASEARAAGFTVTRTGCGGLQDLLDEDADRPLRYLRLAGEERVPLLHHPGQSLSEVAVYRMDACPIATWFAAELAASAPLVALHSAAAAEAFAAEIDRLGLARGTMFLLALGPRIAKAAGIGWAALHLAEIPSDAALLAKAAALCK